MCSSCLRSLDIVVVIFHWCGRNLRPGGWTPLGSLGLNNRSPKVVGTHIQADEFIEFSLSSFEFIAIRNQLAPLGVAGKDALE